MPPPPDPAVLHGMPLFAGLEADALGDVVGQARSRLVPRGTAVFSQGEPAAAGHALIDGRVKIVQTGPDGQQVVLRFIGPGEMFGTLAIFTDGVYPADAVTVADCVELSWPAAAMTALMERHPAIARNALAIVGGRLREVQNRLREVSTERVERRIAHALLRLVRQAGRRVDAGVEINFPLSRQDVAEMTGSTLHTVSRTLSAWEAQGIVESGRQQVVIRKPHALVAIAEDLPAADRP
ncbi:Crp/Fnr family transcriptional regulator [Azospirillum picis]|uniref:CRP-like cAMP-binding protein n=1 Tax=Azospirillum picis TaxID=488438 RepID=A0ABU0MN28_9PROT|nr:Crp/Fnr family transcriptional regulator [Azospirillum picis]MBP2301160.1 CRP-like cAMP-binding protein [Azospirillum picis]MDQ0534878.1 CRP-like cAMP-binding protein [Azospirillum picis]